MAKVVHDAEITCLHSATLSLLRAVVRQVASQCHARMSFAVELACFGASRGTTPSMVSTQR